MKLIFFAIIPMLFLTIISILLGNDLIGMDIAYKVYDATDQGTKTKTITFNISTLEEAGIAILITLITVAAILGINILGSGLTGESARIIIMLILYIGLWTILSIVSWDLLMANRAIGLIIYITLIIIYLIGVSNMHFGGGG